MTEPEIPEMVSIMEATRIARVSRRTIYNWLKAGKIPYIRTIGGAVRIPKRRLFGETKAEWDSPGKKGSND